MKTLKGYFSAFVKLPPEDIKNPPSPPPFFNAVGLQIYPV